MSGLKRFLSVIKRTPSPMLRLVTGEPLEIDGYRLNPQMHWLTKFANGRKKPITDLKKYRSVVGRLMKLLNGPRRENVRVEDTSFAGPGCELPIRIYTPQDSDHSAPAILFFHQGGLVLLDLDTCDTFCTILADECNARVISLDYRLCPENDFPAPIDDALALWDHVQQNAAQLGIDPMRVAVAGDSAGGLIASVLCQQRKAHDGTQPVGQLLIYPWVGTGHETSGSFVSCADTFPLSTEVMEYFAEQVFPGGEGADNPKANPLHATDLSGLPSAVVATAGFDPLRDQGNTYAEKLAGAGVPVVHHCFGTLCHGFIAMGGLTSAADKASVQIARDLAKLL
jgi:acetyl esterase